ncbi:hypothetical protein MJN69_31195, partial [Salmonella enterica subsp. enterica serovar Kentucky]|nr:hypothetical protein [Salmonella enterica subsp. enterica serovar Kentucky]
KNESDVIAIALEDSAGRWVNEWYPGKGDTLALRLGYQGEDLLGTVVMIFLCAWLMHNVKIANLVLIVLSIVVTIFFFREAFR